MPILSFSSLCLFYSSIRIKTTATNGHSLAKLLPVLANLGRILAVRITRISKSCLRIIRLDSKICPFFFFLVSGQTTSVELEIEFSQIFRPIFQIFLHFRFLRVTLDLNFNRIQEKNRNVFEKQDQGLTKQDGYTYILGRNDPSFTFSTEINDERTRNFDACRKLWWHDSQTRFNNLGGKMEILKDRDREKTDSRNLLARVWIRFANLHFQSGRAE